MSAPPYHINLFWSAEDECWIADVPDLRHCTSHGDSPQEALTNVQDAMSGWLAVARDRGIPIPKPHYRPAIYAARFAA
ncbi:type II toxin-antitoxin system HicB family antitoxin [Sphingomonas tabacisoli]|uniref:Type II toxin-antitoxin system HicB family antitoxin n=1 Tax=Sphingomonas tabacisoli TaxID=2249466 RepID=A0ABW4HZC5_9SPHN